MWGDGTFTQVPGKYIWSGALFSFLSTVQYLPLCSFLPHLFYANLSLSPPTLLAFRQLLLPLLLLLLVVRGGGALLVPAATRAVPYMVTLPILSLLPHRGR